MYYHDRSFRLEVTNPALSWEPQSTAPRPLVKACAPDVVCLPSVLTSRLSPQSTLCASVQDMWVKKPPPISFVAQYWIAPHPHPVFLQFGSVQFSRSVVSDSLRPHESQHTRASCPSPAPRVYSNSCPSSQWCHPAISSSVIPFSSCPQSLPAVFLNEC